MWTLVMKRFAAGLLTLLLVMTATFVMIRLLPGGPFQDPKVPPAIQANLERQYHLDQPVPVQYMLYLQQVLLKGDLGPSYHSESRSVNDIVAEAAGYSLRIGLIALVLGTLTGTGLGTLAGVTRSRWLDGLLSLIGVTSLSTPTFIFGGLLVLVFALRLNWLPAATLESPVHYVLPVLTLAIVPFSFAFMLVRNSVRETRNQPFVLVKQSYGLNQPQITRRHVLRNSLVPLVSILGPLAATLITGSFAVEYIFSIPGLGRYFINAVTNRDYPLVMGITLVYSIALVLFNTLTDIAYGVLDPRLRETGRSEGG